MSARETAELLLLAGRLVQAEGYDGELSPAQWMALRYFARANPFSRTPSAFAEFQATTRGTASQAIKALEAGGYLVRPRSKADGRSVSLRLTSKGKKALARDPFEVLVRAVDSLDAKERTAMQHALHQVLSTLAASGAHRRFDVCQDCAHLAGEMCCNQQMRTPRPLNANCSASRSSQRTRVFSASIFSQRASTAMAHMTNGLTSTICGKDA
jgi:DNA-binding MarR family transcriptional regulator